MKRAFLLSLFVSAGLWGQRAPSGYTPNYAICKWASGANPSSDSLNANWTLIDTKIRAPGYVLPDSVIIGAATSPSGVDLYVEGHVRLDSTLWVEDTVIIGAIVGKYAGASSILYVNGLTTSSAGFYAGVPSTTTGGLRMYHASSAYYAQFQPKIWTADRLFYLPDVPNDTMLTAAGDQDVTNGGDYTLDALTIGGTITSGGVAGEGTVDIPVIVDTVSRVAQSGSISATNLTGTTATGVYRVNIYLEADDIPGAADSVYATLQWEGNDGENITESTSAIVLTATTINTHKTFFINHTGAGSVSIQWSTTYASGAGGTDTYLISIVAERLN